MKVCIVSEFYPRAGDPVLGIWAHEQAIAARDAGAEVRVLALHRPIPPRDTSPLRLPGALRTLLAQPAATELDGIRIDYVRFVAPPRPRTYGNWGRWAARPLARALRRLREDFAFDLIHAHNAVPAGDAVRRAGLDVPLIVSVHGGDVFHTALRHDDGAEAIRATFGGAALVLANSRGIEDAVRTLGATRTRVLRLGTDLPAQPPEPAPDPLLATVAHLVGRKRHADVVRALWVLRDDHPTLRYLVVGEGPERAAIERLAAQLGIADRVEMAGQLPHAQALERGRQAHVFVLPSVDEAFGVAYIEAMAAAIPVIGCLGEPGPQEIAAAGDGIVLVPPGDIHALAAALDRLLSDPAARLKVGAQARDTVRRAFTWEACGRATVEAYEDVLAGKP
jgi:glycosyltransferase involved in cell wall biosynthesis